MPALVSLASSSPTAHWRLPCSWPSVTGLVTAGTGTRLVDTENVALAAEFSTTSTSKLETLPFSCWCCTSGKKTNPPRKVCLPRSKFRITRHSCLLHLQTAKISETEPKQGRSGGEGRKKKWMKGAMKFWEAKGNHIVWWFVTYQYFSALLIVNWPLLILEIPSKMTSVVLKTSLHIISNF